MAELFGSSKIEPLDQDEPIECNSLSGSDLYKCSWLIDLAWNIRRPLPEMKRSPNWFESKSKDEEARLEKRFVFFNMGPNFNFRRKFYHDQGV